MNITTLKSALKAIDFMENQEREIEQELARYEVECGDVFSYTVSPKIFFKPNYVLVRKSLAYA